MRSVNKVILIGGPNDTVNINGSLNNVQTTNLEITDKRKIISVRNRIIHGYDQVSDELIWSIITQYLPVLEKEVRQYLNE